MYLCDCVVVEINTCNCKNNVIITSISAEFNILEIVYLVIQYNQIRTCRFLKSCFLILYYKWSFFKYCFWSSQIFSFCYFKRPPTWCEALDEPNHKDWKLILNWWTDSCLKGGAGRTGRARRTEGWKPVQTTTGHKTGRGGWSSWAQHLCSCLRGG